MSSNLFNRFLHKLVYIMPGGYTFRVWLHRGEGLRLGRMYGSASSCILMSSIQKQLPYKITAPLDSGHLFSLTSTGVLGSRLMAIMRW